jgi:hypothetical protein
MPSLWIEQFYKSPLYRLTLHHPIHGKVEAFLNSQIAISTESEWSSMIDNPLDNFSKLTQPITGRSTQAFIFTTQAWQGTEPIMLSLNVSFLAINDARKEVFAPATGLLKWPLPPDRSTPMKLPVPIGGDCCILYHQRFTIPNLLPTTVEVNFAHTYTKDGFPVRADVSIALKTKQAISAKEIDNWFH